jgi:hypothetical protein
MRRLNHGIGRLGGWRFWTGFWLGEAFMAIIAENRRQKDTERALTDNFGASDLGDIESLLREGYPLGESRRLYLAERVRRARLSL